MGVRSFMMGVCQHHQHRHIPGLASLRAADVYGHKSNSCGKVHFVLIFCLTKHPFPVR